MPQVTYIRPPHGWGLLNLRELWEYRELIYFLTWRDIKVRYKQTVIGVLWVFLQPLAMMILFTVMFGKLAQIPSDGIPYPIFAYAGLLAWQMFSRAIVESSMSLVSDQRLITKVYFPRMVIPIAKITAALLDFGIASVFLTVLMLYYNIFPSWNILWAPLLVALMATTALGIGLWLSALNLEFRDVQHTIPFLNQFLFFLTPVLYPGSLIPERWQPIYYLNPMAGVIEGLRYALLGTQVRPGIMLFISAGMALGLCVLGALFFRWREQTFVDTAGGV